MAPKSSMILDVTVHVTGHPLRYSRQVRVGRQVVVGRRASGTVSDPLRIGIAPEWFGVRSDGQVSAEVVVIRAAGRVDDGIRVEWATGSRMHPAGLRLGPTGPDADGLLIPGTNRGGEGRIVIVPDVPARLYVFRLDGLRRFRHRMTLGLRALAVRTPTGGVVDTVRTQVDADVVATARQVRGLLLDSGRRAAVGTLTWRITLQRTLMLASQTESGELAEAVSRSLRQAYPRATVDRVRRDWSDAVNHLVALLEDPDRHWIAEFVTIPGLLDRGGRRLPAREADLRLLAAALEPAR